MLIRIKAFRVNFPNTLIVQSLHQFKPDFPYSPASEIGGIIESVGTDVEGIQPGDGVVAIGFVEKIALGANVCFKKPAGTDLVEAESFLPKGCQIFGVFWDIVH